MTETLRRPTSEIPNHYTPPLSDLDALVVRSVPPGGNWKDIPASVPSKRLAQIRTSYAAGEGSRSTYYGRLKPDAPSYTIGTYIGRPGNGCHIHYDADGGQHRLISQREAARLQSFPDAFEFHGSRSAVNVQIGNAVPPLLAYQVARGVSPSPAEFVDLFCGAGGLSLGFAWAGWKPLAASDWDRAALRTYASNIHERVVEGDIREEAVLSNLVDQALSGRSQELPLWVLGGPPCQGFSTAGKPRSLRDDRNRLFERYRDALVALQPDGFVFENVLGLLNMHGGAVVDLIRQELGAAGYETDLWIVRAEEFGVPQRRHRVLIVGHRRGRARPSRPAPVTVLPSKMTVDGLPASYTAKEALGDLPPLKPGQDGANLAYTSEPQNLYQLYARDNLSPAEFLNALSEGRR